MCLKAHRQHYVCTCVWRHTDSTMYVSEGRQTTLCMCMCQNADRQHLAGEFCSHLAGFYPQSLMYWVFLASLITGIHVYDPLVTGIHVYEPLVMGIHIYEPFYKMTGRSVRHGLWNTLNFYMKDTAMPTKSFSMVGLSLHDSRWSAQVYYFDLKLKIPKVVRRLSG